MVLRTVDTPLSISLFCRHQEALPNWTKISNMQAEAEERHDDTHAQDQGNRGCAGRDELQSRRLPEEKAQHGGVAPHREERARHDPDHVHHGSKVGKGKGGEYEYDGIKGEPMHHARCVGGPAEAAGI